MIFVKRFAHDRSGTSALEYVLFAALIGVVLSVAFSTFVENGITVAWQSVQTAVADAAAAPPPT